MAGLTKSRGVDVVTAMAPPRWHAPAITGLLAVTGTIGLGFVDPNTTHVPLCPLKAATGLDCPFCGSLRAVHALTRFDVGAALDHNLLFVASVPILVVLWVVWMVRATNRRILFAPDWPPHTLAVVMAVAATFGVLRNLPSLTWLASGA